MNNKRVTKCQTCGSKAIVDVVPDDWEDAPASFVMTVECSKGCKKIYMPMTPKEMHDNTGLPLEGWAPYRKK